MGEVRQEFLGVDQEQEIVCITEADSDRGTSLKRTEAEPHPSASRCREITGQERTYKAVQ